MSAEEPPREEEPKDIIPSEDTVTPDDVRKAEREQAERAMGDIGDILDQVPEPMRQIMVRQMAFSGPLPNPLHEKLPQSTLIKFLINAVRTVDTSFRIENQAGSTN